MIIILEKTQFVFFLKKKTNYHIYLLNLYKVVNSIEKAHIFYYNVEKELHVNGKRPLL